MKHNLNIKVKGNYTKAIVRSNLFRQRVERDRTKYTRKQKHRSKESNNE